MITRQLMCVALLLGTGTLLYGQQTPSPERGSMVYENRNQIDYKALTVRTVTGKVHDKQGAAIPKVSLGLFTERGHKLVAVVESASDGTFNFSHISPGRYRLVAKYNGLCPANVPIEVNRQASASRWVDLHMKPRGLDACSYGAIGLKPREKAVP